MGTEETFRPRSSTLLFGVSVVVAVLMAAGVLADPSVGRLVELVWPLIVVFTGYLVFRAPFLRVDDSGVLVRNVLRTSHLPWPTIVRVDTKFALTLYTRDAQCQVWVAPVAGRHATARVAQQDVRHLPESTFGGGGVRPGDALASPSGQAGYLVRRRWDVLRDAGHLDVPEPGREHPATTWNTPDLALGAVLLAVALASLV